MSDVLQVMDLWLLRLLFGWLLDHLGDWFLLAGDGFLEVIQGADDVVFLLLLPDGNRLGLLFQQVHRSASFLKFI